METAFKINKKNKKVRNDTSVQGTNDSSILSKISICQCGYFDDKFLSLFGAKIVRRSPLINRGYFIRARVVDFVLKSFLSHDINENKQIVNLGCGFDSTFYRLKDANLLVNTLFIEIDFPDVINRKFNMINAHKELHNLCPDLTRTTCVNENVVYFSETSNYVLIGADLRDTNLVETILKSIRGFNHSHPTLLLSEVVLTYMAVNSCNLLLKWISQTFKKCLVAAYEQINPVDSFGQVMCAHFNKLGSPLKCILKYSTREAQVARYTSFGYDAGACTMIDFYRQIVTQEERSRIRRLELFDEYEQWHLKCTHYVMVLGSTGNLRVPEIEMLKEHTPSPTSSQINDMSIGISKFPLTFGIRFSHCMCYSSQEQKLFIFGGFGESLNEMGKHKRQRSIEIIDLSKHTIQIIDYLSDTIGDRHFSTSHILRDSRILLLFGRASPSKPLKSLIISRNDSRYELVELNLTPEPTKRWRHASILLRNNQIFVHGGIAYDEKTQDFIVLKDAFTLNLSNNQINQIQTDLPSKHSHTMCLWNEYIVIAGGLNEDEQVLDDILLINSKDFSVVKFQLKKGQIQPRYAHASTTFGNTLILFGGVNFTAHTVGLCMIDLEEQVACEYELPVQDNYLSPLMIVNHQIHLLDNHNLLMIGGGGNSFSFGTHINRQPLIFNISKLCKHFDDFKRE